MATITWSATEIVVALVDVPPAGSDTGNFTAKREEFKIYPEWGAAKTRFVQEIVSRIKGPVAYVEFVNGNVKTAPIPIFNVLSASMVGTGGDNGDAAVLADIISTVLAEEGAQVRFFGSDRVVKVLEVTCRTVRKDALGDVSDNEAVDGVKPVTDNISKTKETRNEF